MLLLMMNIVVVVIMLATMVLHNLMYQTLSMLLRIIECGGGVDGGYRDSQHNLTLFVLSGSLNRNLPC